MSLWLRDVSVAALISVAFYASGLLVIFTPLPFLYVFVARGRSGAITSALFSVAVIVAAYAIFFPATENLASGSIAFKLPIPGVGMTGLIAPKLLSLLGVGYFTFFAVIAIVLGEGATRKWNLMKWGGTALVAGLLVFILMGAAAKVIGISGVVESLKDYLSQIVTQLAALNQSGTNPNADVSFLADHAKDIAAFMLGVAPSLIFVFALIAVVVNMVIGRRLIHRHHAFAHVHNVARFRLPDYAIWAIIACGIGYFANSYLVNITWLKFVAINGLIGMGALYFFQGLAVAAYFLQGIKLPFLRMLAYMIIIFFFQTVALAIVMVGVADVWVDFRLRKWLAKHGT